MSVKKQFMSQHQPSLSTASWEHLAAKTADGDLGSALEFSRALGPWLRALVRPWIWQPDDADEFALEVLQEVIASLKSYNGDRSSIKTWARRIAWRLFADHCSKKRLKRKKTSHQIAHEEKYHLSIRLGKDACLAMAQEVAALDEDDRRLLQLFFEDGLTDTEVAGILDITPDSARQKKRRLIKKLHSTLQTHQSHE